MSIFEIHEEFEKPENNGAIVENENAPAFFDLKNLGDSADVVFLDPPGTIPVLVKLHKIFGFNEGEKYPSWVVDPTSLGQTNHLQTYLEENLKDTKEYGQLSSARYYCMTILRKGNRKDDGTRYPSFRQIRLTKSPSQSKAYGERDVQVRDADEGILKDVDGLYGNWFTLRRPDEQYVPRVGIISDFAGFYEGDLPEPFTADEIKSRLVIPTDGLEEFTNRTFKSDGQAVKSSQFNAPQGDSEFTSDDLPF